MAYSEYEKEFIDSVFKKLENGKILISCDDYRYHHRIPNIFSHIVGQDDTYFVVCALQSAKNRMRKVKQGIRDYEEDVKSYRIACMSGDEETKKEIVTRAIRNIKKGKNDWSARLYGYIMKIGFIY